MYEKEFYDRKLKKTIDIANSELYMNRLGSHCSDKFVRIIFEGTCDDTIRDQIKHDQAFRQYLKENPVKAQSFKNSDNTSQALNKKMMPLFNPPPAVIRLK